MIVIDTSALIAILNKEPERAAFMTAIASDERRMLSAVNLLEARMVMRGRYGDAGVADLDRLLATIDPEIVPFDETLANAAFLAFATYGKGINPTAKLNLCDCIAYALSKSLDAPLLFKGDDFSATDVIPVPASRG